MSERIYISEITVRLSFKDRRSAKRWCQTNYVPLFKDSGSIRLFALRNDFENAYAPKRNSTEMVNSVMNFTGQYFNALVKTKIVNKTDPENESDFLKMLRNIKPDI